MLSQPERITRDDAPRVGYSFTMEFVTRGTGIEGREIITRIKHVFRSDENFPFEASFDPAIQGMHTIGSDVWNLQGIGHISSSWIERMHAKRKSKGEKDEEKLR